MYDERILKFKMKVVEALQKNVEDGDEPIDILDVFTYDGRRSLKLTHFGYRNLKEHYTFFETELDFVENIVYYSTLDKVMTQPYYFSLDKKNKRAILRTTDEKFIKRFKLYRSLESFIKKFHPELDINRRNT